VDGVQAAPGAAIFVGDSIWTTLATNHREIGFDLAADFLSREVGFLAGEADQALVFAHAAISSIAIPEASSAAHTQGRSR